jgi:predicted kinase
MPGSEPYLTPGPPISRDRGANPEVLAGPQRVVLAIGLPGSGKSTWFRRQGITPLSSDELRILLADDVNEQRYQVQIFAALQHLLEVRLDLGRPVTYIDATNLVREQRKPFRDIAKRRGCNLEAVFFKVSPEECLRRNNGRTRRVPEDVMQRMAAALEPPTHEEGFDRIIEIGGDGAEVCRTEGPATGDSQ